MFQQDHTIHPVLALNRCLHRLPLVLDVLDEIGAEASHPGDEDLKHGSHQAVWRMVERLRGIQSHSNTFQHTPTNTEEQIASGWLLGERPKKLLPPTLYGELARVVGQFLPESVGMTSEQRGEPS